MVMTPEVHQLITKLFLLTIQYFLAKIEDVHTLFL